MLNILLHFTTVIYPLSGWAPGLLQVLSASSSLSRVSVFLITTITCFLFTLGRDLVSCLQAHIPQRSRFFKPSGYVFQSLYVLLLAH